MSTTSHGDFKIAEVDGLEVLSLVDNSVDFFSTIDERLNPSDNGRQSDTGKHGLGRILNCLLQNMAFLCLSACSRKEKQ